MLSAAAATMINSSDNSIGKKNQLAAHSGGIGVGVAKLAFGL